jgi:hypothetical protein
VDVRTNLAYVGSGNETDAVTRYAQIMRTRGPIALVWERLHVLRNGVATRMFPRPA